MELVRKIPYDESQFKQSPELTMRALVKEIEAMYTSIAIKINEIEEYMATHP